MQRSWRTSCRAATAAVALAITSSLGAAACGSEPKATQAAEAPAPPPAVSVIEAAEAELESAVDLSGNLVPRTRVDVHARLGGTLEKVLVQIGDRVRAGDVLATMDRREIDAQVDAADASVGVARAGLEAADAALENATQEAERARNLFEKGALPKQRLEVADTGARAARAQRELAKASVAQAEAAFRRAREVQRDATLRAPIAGVVVARNFDPGNLVGPGSERPVVAVAEMHALKLAAGVSEMDAGRLRVGMPARITVPAKPGEIYEGRVAAIAPEVSARNRHFRVELDVSNRGETLLSGMYASARVITDRVSGITLPREAVFAHRGVRSVYRVERDTVAIVPVTEGLSDGTRVHIRSGLAPGDLIVADARREVAEGARVRPIPAH
jgi:RND family efflux transporter MFP subunit